MHRRLFLKPARQLLPLFLIATAGFLGGCKPATLFTLEGEDRVDMIPFQHNANAWNALFQQDTGTAYGWSGGDAAMSLALPYCATCPEHNRYRHFWIFGDSLLSTTDSAGYRLGVKGQRIGAAGNEWLDLLSYRFGNTIGITSHASAGDVSANSIAFDWGKSGAWMPLLLDTTSLPDLDDLRVAAKGYLSLGFENQGTTARVYPQRNSAAAAMRNDLIAIHEYYNTTTTASYYTAQKIEEGTDGFAYQRIAFYIHGTQRSGTVPLYRYFSATYSDYLLTTSDTLPSSRPGYTERTLLGYVYPADSSTRGTQPLAHYFRSNRSQTDFSRVFTTRPNDKGTGILMWPGRAVILGNDLVHVFSPVTTINDPGNQFWHLIETNLIAIVRGVDRPYAQWGKTWNGDWVDDATHDLPQQVVIAHSNAVTKWGYLILKDKNHISNKYVYIYGVRTVDDPLDTELVVARVKSATADEFINFANWRFYSNGNWVTSAADATSIMAANTLADFTIHQSPTGSYILTQGAALMGRGIDFFKAESPVGPFEYTSSFNLETYPNEADIHDRLTYYAINAHDGLSYGGERGGLLISYVRACWASTHPDCFTGIDSLSNRADVYVPRFVNLPWHMIDR